MHAARRTWTFPDLDRATTYRMWFDQAEHRWEVAAAGGDGAPLVASPERAGARSEPASSHDGAPRGRHARHRDAAPAAPLGTAR